MGNQSDFGINAADLNAAINPSKSSYSYWIGAALTATATSTSTGTVSVFHDPTQSFRQDQYNDFYLVFPFDGSQRLITATIGGTITVEGIDNLHAYGGKTYSIQSNQFIAASDATALVTRLVGEIKSAIPEKYRRMLYEVRGELIVERAWYHQATAHTTFQISDTSRTVLWRNPAFPQLETTVESSLISPKDYADGRSTAAAEYSIGTASPTLITFLLGGSAGVGGKLAFGDVIVADYFHSLPTVPRLLKKMALDRAAYEILWQNGLGATAMPEQITKYKEQADAALADLQAGKIGLDEFDQIKLYTETRGEKAQSGYGCVAVDRG